MPLRGPGGFDGLFSGFANFSNNNATVATYIANAGGLGNISVTASGSMSLTADLWCDNLTLNANSTLYCNGYAVFVRQTLAMVGGSTISDDSQSHFGGDGSSGVAGTAGGLARAGTHGGTFINPGAGNGSNSTGGTPSIGIMLGGGGGGGGGGAPGNFGGFGSQGGTTGGGQGSAGNNPGGAGAFAGIPNNQAAVAFPGGYVSGLQVLLTGSYMLLGVNYPVYGGGSGGGGGQDGNFGPNRFGGGGGAGGGIVRIVARKIVKTGAGTCQIRAFGGQGGAGSVSSDAGGGGGGGGGAILIGCSFIDPVIQLDVRGLAGGAAGGLNHTANVGGHGADGRVYIWEF